MNHAELMFKKFPVLDNGFVALADVMGDDAEICRAARVSFGKGTKSVSDDRTLIRYLMRHRHTSPFEMAEIKLIVCVPMDCWRQWIRHRTANVNEYSTRYSEAIDLAQKTAPDAWRSQATSNKQGSGGFVTEWPREEREDIGFDPDLSPGELLSNHEANFHRAARDLYEYRLKLGVAREQARKDLPLSTYTEVYWKCDLHNVLHFLSLRMDPHAQAEIRAYADVIGREIVAPLFPETWAAFEDYRLGGLSLSRLDIEAIVEVGSGEHSDDVLRNLFPNARERDECRSKLGRLLLESEPR